MRAGAQPLATPPESLAPVEAHKESRSTSTCPSGCGSYGVRNGCKAYVTCSYAYQSFQYPFLLTHTEGHHHHTSEDSSILPPPSPLGQRFPG
eukprot:scaffold7242_cov400-Prasinococcus_capsulatus_cf.AAC.18